VSEGFDVYDPGSGYELYDASSAAGAPRSWTRFLGGLGEALITLGLVIALYAVYELWWSNITAGEQTRRNSAALLRTWAAPAPAAAKPSDAIAIGQSFGFLYIPAFGADWRALIMQSVDRTRVLNTGAVGHYTQPPSALPWDASGNFAIAGHRDGHGMVFRDLDQLAVGDRVYVQTAYGWFVYQLDREASSVPINDVGAVEPIPVGSGFTEPGRYITLTTCTPIYIDSNRMVWWGHLIEQTPKGRVPAGVTPIS
jgi:LPXTG-site transpeptidase (sortase) family protein